MALARPFMWIAVGGLIASVIVHVSSLIGFPQPFGPDSDSDSLRLFSGHWMIFYFAGMAMLYSAVQLGSLGPRKCPQGHEVPPFAKFCEVCGAPLSPDPIS